MRIVARLAVALVAAVALAGCYFDNPLTGWPSKNLNTWLLGVWESKSEDGRISRVMVTPIDNGRYFVDLALAGKKPRETRRYQLEAWPSRVGDTTFLTLKCLEGSGEMPPGAYAFIQVQLLNQNTVRIRTLKLDSAPDASSFELRKEVRRKLKDRTLYSDEATTWSRVEEVFWSGDGEKPTFTPLRNPTY